jgi:hypothetical protein
MSKGREPSGVLSSEEEQAALQLVVHLELVVHLAQKKPATTVTVSLAVCVSSPRRTAHYEVCAALFEDCEIDCVRHGLIACIIGMEMVL